MNRSKLQGFTLIEVLTVIVIILIIAGWVISAFGPGNQKAARAKALGQIKTIETACESFKADNGVYPREEGTTEGSSGGSSPIDPKKDGNASSAAYKKSTLFLYKKLSGDENANNQLNDGEPPKGYMVFTNDMFGGTKDAAGKYSNIQYIQDPFGNSYGYSTAGAKVDEEFRAAVMSQGAAATRPESSPGFNTTFDLWSTSGKSPSGSAGASDADRNRWVKNW